jgi:hypothetical protein
MDYGDTRTRRALWEIFDVAKDKTGFDAAREKVTVKVYPRKDGCEVVVDAGCREDAGFLYFETSDALLDAIAAARSIGISQDAELYHGGGWALFSEDERLISAACEWSSEPPLSARDVRAWWEKTTLHI